MNIINYLKNDQLVAGFQHFFGIQPLDEQSNAKKSSSHFEMNEDNLKERNQKGFKNGINLNGIKKVESTNDLNKQSIYLSNNLSTKLIKLNHKKNYIIKNLAFYYIFCFGASLGYANFYATFFPFFLYNIDFLVGRRIIFIWAVTMYIGQALKDIIRWKRPKSPPVVVLEPEYSLEYGMPSTHAMVGFALPFSILIFTQSRFIYPFWAGFVFSSVWCLLVCGSRLYLGMHSVLDVLAGFLLSATILFILVPFIDLIDQFNLKNSISPFLLCKIVFLMSYYYPKSDRWTPARGDTSSMIGFGLGVQIGSWLNYQLDMMTDSTLPTPFQIHLPTKWAFLLILIRTIIGTSFIELTRLLGKKLMYSLICKVQNLNSEDSESAKIPSVEVPLKLATYTLVGIIITHPIPILFKYFNIQ